MIPDARIEVTAHPIYIQGEPFYRYFSYEWKGKRIAYLPHHILQLHEKFPQGGEVFRIGLFLKVRVIKVYPHSLRILVMRESPQAWLTWKLHQRLAPLDLFYRRLVVALSVFNLADCPPGSIPTWRQLKWFNGDKK